MTAFWIAIAAVFIALIPAFKASANKSAEAKRARGDGGVDGGTAYVMADGTNSGSSDCGSDGGGGDGGGGCD